MRVVNFMDYGSQAALDEAFGERWIYVGREMPDYDLAGSPLGNPFLVESHGRPGAVELYRKWLRERIQAEEQDVLNQLSQIEENSVLVCWCKPLQCHGDVVVAAWERFASEDAN